jgi:ESX secretion-associated protein EspD/H
VRMTVHGLSWDDDGDVRLVELGTARRTSEENDEVPIVMFTVANPPGTASVTAVLGGRVHGLELTAAATEMSEAQLAEEIVVLAGLAAKKAQAAQHDVIVELMRSMGHDSVATSGFLERSAGLPSPRTVEVHTAEIFADRYPPERDW